MTDHANIDHTGLTGVGGSATAREELVAIWLVLVTKTNVGSTYVDLYTDTNIQANPQRIDFAGKTEYRVDVNWNKIGTGPQFLKVCGQSADTEILHEFTNLATGGNTSGLVSIPGTFTGESEQLFKLMVKSTTAADDPVFFSCRVYLK